MSSSSTSASVAVDKATSDLLLGPDWTTNMEICDSVNSHHWQAKDVVKAVKRRLQHKSPRVQLLALTLLETLMKNCGDYLHFHIVEKNILGEMVKIVKKKADMQVRDKVLGLMDSWQGAFGGAGGKYPQYYWAYDELRRSGVEFPRRSVDAAPVITPPATRPTLRQPHVGYGIPHVGYGMPSGSSRRLDEAMATEIEGLSLSSLEAMREVMDLLSDMLQAVDPGDRGAVRDEVIVDLVEQCRSNQKKLMQMLTTTGDEELLAKGLEINDSLQTLLAKHDAIASGSPLAIQASKPVDLDPIPKSSSEAKDSSSSSPVTASVSLGKSPIDEEDEEEDEFAQLARRHSKPATLPTDGNGLKSEKPSSVDDAAATCNALALPDPPAPVNTSKEQDIIDLLSLTLSTPSTPPVSDQNTRIHPQASEHYPENQWQLPFNSYVAPWARPQQPSHIQGPLPPQLQPQPQARPQYAQYQYGYPPPPWENSSTSSSNMYSTPRSNATTPFASAAAPDLPGRSLQYSNSFPARLNNNNNGESMVASGQKPFVPSYRLFEDLNVFGNNKTGNGGAAAAPSLSGSQTQQQGMSAGGGGRK
ncbi:PREDICTED: TOM1-like protein 2 [Tarenaya hassleriana]|uniref:TOM1-like protein 2 n=1 Tax=Tarenaya hassleriana TaxID=28532 RepID=UPI00053C57D6|nr:PREDICTED: TOM1-like protein 2 [Tarenaya hassleriana]